MYNERFVANATLVDRNPKDGSQKYQLDRQLHNQDVVWLSGITRASNVKIGDKGQMYYVSTSSYGLLFFRKDK